MYEQSAFVVRSIDAAYAYAYALKVFHDEKCGAGNPIWCEDAANRMDEFIDKVCETK